MRRARATAPRRRLIRAAGATLVVIAAGLAGEFAGRLAEPAPGRGERALLGAVTRVVDGDTLRLDGQAQGIRIWGLDAPERDTPGGPAATRALTELVAGRTLSCRVRDRDHYGRAVGQCFLPDGTDVTAAMIASGTAREYCRYSNGHYRTC